MKIRRKIYGTVFAILCLGIIPTFTYGVFEQNGFYYVGDAGQNIINGSYTYNIDNKVNFYTEYGNDTTKSFYWSVANAYGYGSLIYNIGWYNGKLYFLTSLDGTTQVQGFIQNICIKPTSSRGNENLHNDCTYNTSIDTLNNIKSINGYAFELIGQSGPGYSNGTPMQFCFSDGINDYCLQCGFMNNECASGLTGTLNITNTDFNSIKNINWTNSPIKGTGGQGIPVVNVSCPTIQQLINSYQEQYQPGLCYSSEKIWSGNGFVSLTPKTIFELYPNYTGFAQDINTYYNYCNNSVSTATTCQQAFAGKEEQYTLISKIPNNVNDVKLYQYCHLELNYENKNVTVCVDSGAGTNPTIPIESIIDEIVRKPRQITLPGNTEQDGTGNITGDNIFSDIVNGEDIEGIGDVINSLQSVYNKLTGLFYRRSGVDGIIPDIIVRILLLIILFKIFKK